ncbi:MAG: S-layer homology domain-containing protein [Clostridiales Family XIII bacterium]|nr:S-layer homology domain-containing protein [Clostridiales Family XIII bacterium]
MKKKAASFAVAAALSLLAGAFVASPAFAADLNDISGHWAEGDILAGVNYGYITGYTDGSFKPEATITRAEFVTIINKSGNYTAMTNIPFRDVPVNEWYFQEVQRAYNAGYIQGDSEGNFKPNAQITRQEAAVILNRIAPGGDTSYALTGVVDADIIDAWALPAVKAVYNKGYIKGDDDGRFDPMGPLKRCQAVAIVNRVLGISPLTPGTALAALSISNINITDVKTDGATLNLTTTRDGTVYWVVLTGEGATTPTAEQILSGRASDNTNAYGSGSRSVYANSAITASLTSLQSEQSYKVCAVARDAAANLSPVAIRTFTTSVAGDTGEEWIGSGFTVSNIDNNALTLTVGSSRAGTLYYVIVEDPNRTVKTPTQAYIKNGRDASNSTTNVISGSFSVSSSGSVTADITGLKSGTNYKIFGCVYESSSSGSLYSKVKSGTFTTTGSYVDWITSLTVPSSVSDATSVGLSVMANRAGTFYYVVTENATQPRATQIRNGYDYKNFQGVARGSIGVSANTAAYPTLTGLTAGKTYYVFGVLIDSSSVLSEIESRSFTTTAMTLSVSYAFNAPSATTTTTQGGIIGFSNSGTSYTAANPTIDLSGNNSGADVTISVTKASTASSVAAALGSTSLTPTTTSSTNPIFRINNGNVPTGTTTLTITVTESGKSLTYTIYIKK